MKDANKTKNQLIDELKDLRRKVDDLEESALQDKLAEAALPKGYAEQERRVDEHTSELSKANQELNRVIASVPDYLWSGDVDEEGQAKYNYFSPVVEKITGRPPEFYLPGVERWLSTIHPDDREMIEQNVATMLSLSPGQHRQEYRIIKPDGRIRWVCSSVTVTSKVGGGLRLDGVVSDITNLKQAQESLKESETRFSAFMDNLPANVYIKDENGKHVYANRTLLEYMGCNLEKLIGTTSHDLFPPEVAEKLETLDQMVLSEKSNKVVEEWSYIRDGDRHWLRDIKFPIHLKTGKNIVGGIAVEITDIKKTEERLRKTLAEIEALKDRLQEENIYLREEIAVRHEHEEIIGESDAIQKVLSQAEQVADTDTTVLLLGETGTGKELLARAIHNISARKARPMIKVNCAALPPTLIESELFGREKGAYTGALTKQKGRFEVADGSTIFLDEISELPLELQSKLLRVLQEGHFERLGSSKTIAVNVRIIAATNQNLSQAVQEGRFREDLYYRLNVFPITVPPLRERQEDIPTLVWAFVKEFEKTMAKRIKSIPRKSMQALQRYPWPGNVRELRNIIEQAMIISKDKVLNIRIPDMSDLITEPEIKLIDVERNHIVNILENTGWRIKGQNGAAKLLGLHPATLYSRMKRLGIQRPT
jgi:PAS domain S-box-containing protein